jgi:hypothetical protein
MRDLLASSLIVFFALNGSPLDSFAQQTVAPATTAAPAVAPVAPPTVAAPAMSLGPDAAGKYMLREGEDVNLVFAQDLSSKTSSEGDPITFTLVDDLKVGGVVVAKAGAKAVGEVTKAEKSGNYLKVGDTKIKLRGTKGKEGQSGTTGAIVLTVLFGPLGLIKHGKNVEIKQGQSIHAFVSDDVALPPVS